MTCIVGLQQDGHVWIGGDSAGVDGWDLTVRADPKVFRRGPFVIGFTTSFRMGQVLRYELELPEQRADEETHAFLITGFVAAVRNAYRAAGINRKENDVESGGEFLIGYRGELWGVHSDYQVSQPADGFLAVGCGRAYALGAMAANAGLSPSVRIGQALSIAERFSAGVRGPFTIEALP